MNYYRWWQSIMPYMRLWTIQHEAAWHQAETTGVLKADGRRVEACYRPAYRWLSAYMRRQLPSYAAAYPIWAWAQPKPDLRRSGHLPPGSRGVRIEFIAPNEEVLLSDFDAWHAVLMQSHLALDEAEADAFEAEETAAKNEPARQAKLQRVIEASWLCIFNLELWQPVEASQPSPIQATLGKVSVEQVVRVDYFRAR